MPQRLFLFDIDHTLVDVLRYHEQAYEAAMLTQTGAHVRLRAIPFSGKTTPNIFRELCALAGVAATDAEARLPALLDSFQEALLAQIGGSLAGDVLPGVPELLACLAGQTHVLGVLTGNPPEIGRAVLDRARLLPFFRVFAFGTDAPQRPALVPLAMARATKVTGHTFNAGDVVVVGDSPHDVDAGRRNGARTVAVCTGLHTAEQLRDAGADLVLPNFSDHQAACHALAAVGTSQ